MDMPITEVAKVGLVLDKATALLPPEAWTAGENVKFSVDGISRQWGDIDYSETPFPLVPRMLLASARVETSWAFLAVTDDGVYYSLNDSVTELMGVGEYTLVSDTPVTGCLLNNLPVWNHSDYQPQFWNGLVTAALPGLDPSIRFNVLRAFGNFLVGIGVKDIGSPSLDLNRIMWSGVADPGTVPPTWNPIGSLAGSTILASARGDLIDCLPLGDVNYIYASNAVYTMQYVGGSVVFKFALRFEDFGILAPNCVASFKNQHFVVTPNDFIVHNGVSWDSVGSGLVRRYFSETINVEEAKNTFVVVQESQKEIWVIYPSRLSLDGSCDTALIWNWELKNWGIRKIGNTFCGVYGYKKDVVTWEDLPNWDQIEEAWSDFTSTTLDGFVCYGRLNGRVAMCAPVMTQEGQPFITRIERRALGFETQDRFRNLIANPKSQKLVLEVWPILRYINDTVRFYIGGQDDFDSTPYWEGPFEFNPTIDRFITPAISGQYIAIRMEYDGLQDFLLEGYMFKYEEVGIYT